MRPTGPTDQAPSTHTRPAGAADRYGSVDAEGLLALALSQPPHALAIANHLIAQETDQAALSVAHQVVGVVLRDVGRHAEALTHLRTAARLARKADDKQRLSDVRATLGATLVSCGRVRAGITQLDLALSGVHGLDRARVRLRRAHAFLLLGRATAALEELRPALVATHRAGDRVWEARCLVHQGWARSSLGLFEQADVDARRAGRLFTSAGQHHEAAWTISNRGDYAYYQGDLPKALALLDSAETQFRQVGQVPPDVTETRCRVVLAAGLGPEALEAALTAADTQHTPPLVRAELLLVAAAAALRLGDLSQARFHADHAAALFRAQQRGTWATRARFVKSQARDAPAQGDAHDLRAAIRLADKLTRQAAPEAALAHLVAGRLALDLGGHRRTAERELRVAAGARRTGSALSRSTGWLARAFQCGAAADRPGLLNACRRGLDALDEYRITFGDNELRALATDQGRDLAELALSTVLAWGRARELLWWSERWRATALTSPPVHPPEDAELAAALAGARAAGARLTDPQADTATLIRARQDRNRHEANVRRRTRQLAGATSQMATIDLRELVEAVGTDALVSLVDVRGCLFAVLVAKGRIARHEVGPTGAALRESEFARFSLRRAAYGRPADLARVGARLQPALLGDLARRLPERVVIVPPAALHAAPWALLPALTESRLSVMPSARLWLQSCSRPAPAGGRVVFVTGPGLTSEATEAATVSTWYADTTILSGADATVATTLPHLEGARLAHIAAHGSFRADAPMFSSLQLADGPLYIHDLDSLRRPPHTLILSACDAGDTAAVGVDEGLGLVTSLLGLGASSVLASVVPVNDAATIPVMARIHSLLASGADLPIALREARLRSGSSPGESAAASSFTAWAP